MRGKTSRLETVAPALVRSLGLAGEPQRRAAALAGATLAVERTGLTNVVVLKALDTLNAGGHVDAACSAALDGLLAELDEIAWSIQDQVDSGERSYEDYLVAFQRARAAASAAFAADADASTAALEGLYEADAAIDDLDALMAAVLPTLEPAAGSKG